MLEEQPPEGAGGVLVVLGTVPWLHPAFAFGACTLPIGLGRVWVLAGPSGGRFHERWPGWSTALGSWGL